MVLKIQRPADQSPPKLNPPPPMAAGGPLSTQQDNHPSPAQHSSLPPPLPPPHRVSTSNTDNKRREHKELEPTRLLDGSDKNDNDNNNNNAMMMICHGCGVSEEHSSGALLPFDDPEEDADRSVPKRPEDGKRYCPKCMTGKKVRVFWPVDSQWYIALVVAHDDGTGEHLLKYPDGDTEWVRIGEDHTTNACYYNSLAAGGGGGGGVSFGLSGLGTRSMSQGEFGLSRANTEEERTMPLAGPLHKSSQRHPFQQLHLTRTASSMSSFGLGRQHSFAPPEVGHQYLHGQPPFHILPPNFTHSFSSKFGEDPVTNNAGQPPPNAKRARTEKDANKPPQIPFGSESWDHPSLQKPPSYYYHDFPDNRAKDAGQHPQQREEKDGKTSSMSPGQRDGPTPPGHGDGPTTQHGSRPPPTTYPGHHPHRPYEHQPAPPNGHMMQQPPWGTHPPPHGYGAPPNMMYNGQRNMFPYMHQPPAHHTSSEEASQSVLHAAAAASAPSLITPGAQDPTQSKPPSQPTSNQTQQQLTNHISSSDMKQKKAPTKAWTKEEDDQLLDMVLAMKHPLKWSIIASSMSTERTGKQCRERYVNHLNPRLKSTEWTPTEDFTIWRLYATCGTQWAKMSKVIPGRTDNGIKNRYHNLKRQLDREEESRLRAPEPHDYERKIHSKKIREVPTSLKGPIEKLWNVKRGIGMIAAMTVDASLEEGCPESPYESMIAAQKSSRFGPFEKVSGTEPVQCLRCGLYAPSVQCGTEICTKTRWCKTCTMIPMHLGGNVLRECMGLRRCQDDDLVDIVEKLTEDKKHA